MIEQDGKIFETRLHVPAGSISKFVAITAIGTGLRSIVQGVAMRIMRGSRKKKDGQEWRRSRK